MYGSQATQAQIEAEQGSGYNIFGGKSLFDNENSARSRTRYVQELLDRLSSGKSWGDYNAADIFGSKVKPALFENAPYQPIDYGEVQSKTIGDNQRNMPDITALIDSINTAMRHDSSLRADEWAPGFTGNLRTMTDSAKALLGGRLPYSDEMDEISRTNEVGNIFGTAGTFGMATLKDLGMKKLQGVEMGASMMSRIGNLMESIDPIGQRSRPQDFTLSPSQTVPLKQQDTQFGASYDQMERILTQQSEQNAEVLNAAADPAGRGLFGAEFALKTGTPIGGAGGAAAGGGMDWGGLISSIYGSYRTQQQGGSNPYQGQTSGERYNPDSQWGANYGYDDGSSGWENFANAGDYSQ